MLIMMTIPASPVGHPSASIAAASSQGALGLPQWRADFIASANTSERDQSETSSRLTPSAALGPSRAADAEERGPSAFEAHVREAIRDGIKGGARRNPHHAGGLSGRQDAEHPARLLIPRVVEERDDPITGDREQDARGEGGCKQEGPEAEQLSMERPVA